MNDRKEYPIDTESLAKGDKVTVSQVEEAYSVSFGTDAYNLAALRMSAYIERRFRERGVVVTVVMRKGEIWILTDSDAAIENRRQFELKVSGAARAHVRAIGVDRSNLTDGDLAIHDRTLETQGRQLAAMRDARRLPKPTAHKRSTPLPPGAVKKESDDA